MMFPPGTRPHTRVKICGITHPDDAALAIGLGAEALGLNFYGKSLRFLDVTRDVGWLRELSGIVRRVGVMVNPARDEIARLLDGGLIDAVQLHGDEGPSFCLALEQSGIPFAKALRMRDAGSVLEPERFHTKWFVLDAFSPGAYGGTGITVDWTLAAAFAARGLPGNWNTILSGGLQPGNVADAIRTVRPFAVDVASGVELPGAPRRKDAGLLREFFAAVQSVRSDCDAK